MGFWDDPGVQTETGDALAPSRAAGDNSGLFSAQDNSGASPPSAGPDWIEQWLQHLRTNVQPKREEQEAADAQKAQDAQDKRDQYVREAVASTGLVTPEGLGQAYIDQHPEAQGYDATTIGQAIKRHVAGQRYDALTTGGYDPGAYDKDPEQATLDARQGAARTWIREQAAYLDPEHPEEAAQQKDPYSYLANNALMRQFGYGLSDTNTPSGNPLTETLPGYTGSTSSVLASMPDAVKEGLRAWFQKNPDAYAPGSRGPTMGPLDLGGGLERIGLPHGLASPVGGFVEGVAPLLAGPPGVLALSAAQGANSPNAGLETTPAELLQVGANAALAGGAAKGLAPALEPLVGRATAGVLGETGTKLAAEGLGGAAINTALTGAGQGLEGQFDPKALGVAALQGGAMAAGPGLLRQAKAGVGEYLTAREATANARMWFEGYNNFATKALSGLSTKDVSGEEPPVPEGMVRLYRGNSAGGAAELPVPDWVRATPAHQATVDATGRWFTDSPERAQWYAKEGSGGISYIDVPAEQAAAYNVSANPEAARFSADPEHEFLVPRDVSRGKQPLSGPANAEPLMASPPSEGRRDGGWRPGMPWNEQPADALPPEEPPGATPPVDSAPTPPGRGLPVSYGPNVDDFIGLKPADMGLTRIERAGNAIKQFLKKGMPADAIATPLHNQQQNYATVLRSWAAVGAEYSRRLEGLFSIDKDGLVTLPGGVQFRIRDAVLDSSWASRPSVTPGESAPGLAQTDASMRAAQAREGATPLSFNEIGPMAGVPSNWERISPLLTDEQRAGMEKLIEFFDRYRKLADAVGVQNSGDIGNYLPRGVQPQWPQPANANGTTGVIGGSNMERLYGTQAEGVAAGETYKNLPDAVHDAALAAGQSIVDQHIANQLLSLRDANGPVFTPVGGQPAKTVSGLSQLIDAQGNPVEAPRANNLGITQTLGGAPLAETPRGSAGKKTLNFAPMQDYEGPAALVDTLNNAFNKNNEPGVGRWAMRASTTLTQAGTSFDFVTPSRLLLQGTMTPGAWLEAMGVAARSLLNPAAMGDWVHQWDPTGEKITAAIRDNRIKFDSIQGRRNTLELGGHDIGNAPVYRNASRFVGSFTDVLRLKALDSATDAVAKKFAATGQAKYDPSSAAVQLSIGKGINRATGGNDFKYGTQLGGLIQFPNWLASQFSLVGSALHGNQVDNQYAREAFVKLAGLGVMFAYGVNMAGLMAEGDFNPVDLLKSTQWKDGLPVAKVGGVEMNPFLGAWSSLVKTALKTSPVSLDREHSGQNPLTGLEYFGQAKGGPLVRGAISLARGQTPGGDFTRDSLPDFAQFAARSVAPFSLSQVDKESFTNWKQALADTAGAVGAHAFLDQQTPFQVAAQQQDKAIRSAFADDVASGSLHSIMGQDLLTTRDLSPAQMHVFKASPEYTEHKALIDKAIADAGAVPHPADAIFLQQNDETDRHAKQLAAIEAQYRASGDGNRLRHDVTEENTLHFRLGQSISQQARETPAGENIRDPRPGHEGERSSSLTVEDLRQNYTPEGQAVSAYYRLADDPSVKQADGTPNYDQLDALQQQFLANLPAKIRDAVTAEVTYNHGKGVTDSKGNPVATPGLAALRGAQADVAPFWKLADDSFQQLRQDDPQLAQFKTYQEFQREVATYAAQQGLSVSQAMAGLESVDPELAYFNQQLKLDETQLRLENPKLSEALAHFYGRPGPNPQDEIASLFGDTSYADAGAPMRFTGSQAFQFAQQYNPRARLSGSVGGQNLLSSVFGLSP